MSRDKVVDATAVRVILDGDTVAVGGFVGIGVPEELAVAVEQRFLDTGHPRDLTLVFAAGPGDRKTKGLNHFARAGWPEPAASSTSARTRGRCSSSARSPRGRLRLAPRVATRRWRWSSSPRGRPAA